MIITVKTEVSFDSVLEREGIENFARNNLNDAWTMKESTTTTTFTNVRRHFTKGNFGAAVFL